MDCFFQLVEDALSNCVIAGCRHRILPDQVFGRNLVAHIARFRPHVAMGQLEPGLGEGQAELLRIIQEALGDLAIFGVVLKRHVRGGHNGRVELALDMRVRDRRMQRLVSWHPDDGAARATSCLPLEIEEILQVERGPLSGGLRPGAFEAAGHGVLSIALTALVLPAKTLLFQGCAARLHAHAVLGIVCAMHLAKCMTAGGQCNRFLVIHRHATERDADVRGGGQRVRITLRTFRIHINETHVSGAQRTLQLAIAVLAVAGKHFHFRAPVNQVRLPVIGAAEGEAVGLETHVLHADGSRQDHQVGPGQGRAILLFDRPQQASRLVQVAVVRPAV